MKNIKVRVGEGRGVGGVLRFAWNKTLGPDILWNSVVCVPPVLVDLN